MTNIEKKVKVENPEFYSIYKRLQRIPGDRNYISLDSRWYDEGGGFEINVTIHTTENELYGTIYSKDKIAKLTTASGPNPLDPEFLKVLNRIANILKDYKQLHY